MAAKRKLSFDASELFDGECRWFETGLRRRLLSLDNKLLTCDQAFSPFFSVALGWEKNSFPWGKVRGGSGQEGGVRSGE